MTMAKSKLTAHSAGRSSPETGGRARAARYTSEEVRRALFPRGAPEGRAADVKGVFENISARSTRAVGTDALVRLFARDDPEQVRTAESFTTVDPFQSKAKMTRGPRRRSAYLSGLQAALYV